MEMLSDLRDAGNAALFVVCLSMVVAFFQFIRRQRRLYGCSKTARDEAAPAIFMLMFCLGEGIRHGALWISLHIYSVGGDPSVIKIPVMLAVLFGSVIAIAGGMLAIRLFGRKRWGKWSWVITLLFATLFGVCSVA